MAQICFDTTTFYTVMIAGFSIIIYVIITIYKEKLQEAKNLLQHSTVESTPTVVYSSQPFPCRNQIDSINSWGLSVGGGEEMTTAALTKPSLPISEQNWPEWFCLKQACFARGLRRSAQSMVSLGIKQRFFEIKWKVASLLPLDQATLWLSLMATTDLFTGHAEDIAVWIAQTSWQH